MTLTYNAENQLTAVSGAATASFVYDGDGNRVKATVGGVTTTYLGNYYEWNGTAGVKYYYAGSQRVAMRTAAGIPYFLLGDHLGSTSIVATAAGGFYSELRYGPWGETVYSSGTTPTNYHFTGQREETGIGLYFYGARWYDTTIRRWMQADTVVPGVGNPQNLNRYTFVLNNPVKYNDPTGHRPDDGCQSQGCADGGELDRLP